MKRRWKILCLVLAAFLLLYLNEVNPFTLDLLLNWQPEHSLLAAAIVLLGFTVKATVMFLPLKVFQILAGHFFTGGIALAVNIMGQVLVATIPYWIGRKAGKDKVLTLMEKYPKAQNILAMQNNNRFAMCFLLRACAVPPGDLVTMYLGATGMPYTVNLFGGVLGSFPSLALATFLGANIREPGSPEFWFAVILNVVWIVATGLGFYLYKKNHKEPA